MGTRHELARQDKTQDIAFKTQDKTQDIAFETQDKTQDMHYFQDNFQDTASVGLHCFKSSGNTKRCKMLNSTRKLIICY